MQLDFKKLKQELIFVPLGGAGEIGMNFAMYHVDGKWLIIDVGIGFADAHYPGVDVVVPDIDFAVAMRKNIVGIVLTHAHEDHIGGIPYLWNELQAPIYTHNFTGVVLKAKLSEHGLLGKVPITIVGQNSPIDIGPFNVELINITHSILENSGVVIKTARGNIFHTGDWKLDDNPVLGEATNEERLKAIGEEGILAMVGDSTNIFDPGRSGSEGNLELSLLKLISDCHKGMVVVTTFASNVTRLHSIAKAAKASGRRVVLSGRSLWRMYRAALDCGYLADLEEFLEERAVAGLPREKILVISTGCQGEALASVNKLASNTHQSFKMIPGDTIIFSSKIIPGNEKKIYSLFNRFCKMGIEVLTEKDHFVHVSGHPAREEVAAMYRYIKPLIAIPVHGEHIHIHYHAKFAIENGCKHAVEVTNGDVLAIREDGAEKLGRVQSGYVLIDGESLIPSESPIIKTRRRMRDNGSIFVTASAEIRGKNTRLHDVMVTAPGLLDSNEDEELIAALKSGISDIAGSDLKSLKEQVTIFVRKFSKRELNKFPEVVAHILS